MECRCPLAAYDLLIDDPIVEPRRPTSLTLDLRELVRLAERGQLRVPRYQRPYVWHRDDVLRLFDSIWRGIPIGQLLWVRRSASAERISFGPAELDVPDVDDANWILDGYQRIASLVGVLSTQVEVGDPFFEVSFDLQSGRFVAGGEPWPNWWLPLRGVLDSRIFTTRLRDLDLSDEEFDRVDALEAALRHYQVNVFVVDEGDDELLVDLVDRVGRGGQRRKLHDELYHLFGTNTEAPGPAAVAETLRHHGFGTFDDGTVVQSVLAVRGVHSFTAYGHDLREEFGPDEDPAEWFGFTEQALGRAIRFLQAQGVPHFNLVLKPRLIIGVLAAFFHQHRQLGAWNERLLSRWLWRAQVAIATSGEPRPTGGVVSPNYESFLTVVHGALGESEVPLEYETVRALLDLVPPEIPEVAWRPEQWGIPGWQLVASALASLQPLDPEGALVDVARVVEQSGIWRGAALGFKDVGLAAVSFWPPDADPPTGDEPEEVLTSHAIPPGAAAALRRGDVEQFLGLRREALNDVVTRFLTARIEPGAPVRPPLADLIVPDDEVA